MDSPRPTIYPTLSARTDNWKTRTRHPRSGGKNPPKWKRGNARPLPFEKTLSASEKVNVYFRRNLPTRNGIFRELLAFENIWDLVGPFRSIESRKRGSEISFRAIVGFSRERKTFRFEKKHASKGTEAERYKSYRGVTRSSTVTIPGCVARHARQNSTVVREGNEYFHRRGNLFSLARFPRRRPFAAIRERVPRQRREIFRLRARGKFVDAFEISRY